MSKLKVLEEPNKILRQVSKEVFLSEITTKKIQILLQDMSETLRSIEIGVGLAAPQVGQSLRIFLVSEEALETKRNREKLDVEELKGRKKLKNWKHFVFINPKVIKTSKRKKLMPEGCLSVQDLYGRVMRQEKITVSAWDESGKKFTRGASGLFAQVIQHELDHLNGILFIDKAKEIRKIEPPK